VEVTNTMADFEPGDRVRFTTEHLGAARKNGPPGKMIEKTYSLGDEGTVETVTLPDGWIAVTPDDDEHVYVPVHPGMIEKIR